jgi:hypothetical protein
LDDEVSIARQMGQSDDQIRDWVIKKLRELVAKG